MNKLKQTTTLSQRKVLSQQTRQAIRLLQLNSYDLEKEVDNLVLENPLLEKNEEIESNYDVGSTVSAFDVDADDILKYHKKSESLQESLSRQVDLSSFSVNEKIIASILIDCVNDNGYLTEDLKDIFIQANREIEASFQEIFYVLHTLQRFDPVGTCAMGIRNDSVTNPNLKVNGIRKLRIVDASVMPSITSGNTNSPTLMIAEKASEMILDEV